MPTLPSPLSSFVGRASELTTLESLAREARLLTLTGPGGIGKTRLALELADRLSSHFAQRVWFVELAPLAASASVERAVARALQVAEHAQRSDWELLVDALAERPALLILDNCEHLLDASARLAERLLRVCPSLRIVATSRQSLGIGGEYAWRVPSLDLPLGSAPPDMAVKAEALQLFVDRARAAQPGFVADVDNTAALVRISRRLDGIPLAIELAAARLNVLSVDQLADRLERHLAVLGGGSRTALPRQRTLEATLDWSFVVLEPLEQVLFRRLAALAGGFTLESAEAVCCGGELRPELVFEVLAQLVDKSLVVVAQRPGRVRYRLLEPVRQYAAEKLGSAGEEHELRTRHREWCVDLVQRAAGTWRLKQDSACLDELELELDNVRAALDWCSTADEAPAGLELLDSLWFYWNVRGQLGEWRDRVEALLLLPSAGQPSPVRARGLNAAGYLAFAQGDEPRARELHLSALLVAREVGDAADAAMALRRLGMLARLDGDMRAASAQLEESLQLLRQLDDESATCLTLYTLADTLRAQARYGRAIELYEECVGRMRRSGDHWHSGMALLGLGYAAALNGDHDAAGAALGESLRILHGLGDRRVIAGCLEGFACLASQAGQPARAAYLFGCASALRDRVNAAAEALTRADNEQATKLARQQLGDDSFEAIVDRGREQTLEAAIAFALSDDATPPARTPTTEAPRGLTRREHEVASLLARGLTNRAIAAELVISEQTAETHVKRILSKLGLDSRVQVAARAAKLGLLGPTDDRLHVPT